MLFSQVDGRQPLPLALRFALFISSHQQSKSTPFNCIRYFSLWMVPVNQLNHSIHRCCCLLPSCCNEDAVLPADHLFTNALVLKYVRDNALSREGQYLASDLRLGGHKNTASRTEPTWLCHQPQDQHHVLHPNSPPNHQLINQSNGNNTNSSL